MSRKVINWSRDLGNPTTPGKYTVSGVGEVQVEQENIDEAARLGENVDVEIHDATTFGHSVRQYIIGLFIPA
ncbi:MAG: hypothetical protein ACJ74W_05930 [Pyrinomonadaceae bacterium]